MIEVIRCPVCGDKGHIARDCPKKESAEPAEAPAPPTVVTIPTSMIGQFIGVQGSNIKRLMIETGCNIQVDQAQVPTGATSCPLMFHGPRDAIDKARTACQEWINQAINRTATPQTVMTATGGFLDDDAAAKAVQMAYMQQMYYQAWMSGAYQPPQ